jgi:DNA invertase Pin-like site-specific DNA recombinase
MRTKAYAYLRVSGKSQVEKGGFPRQEATIAQYAKAHGIEIVKTYKEEAVSGTTDETARPAFREMVSDILKNGVRLIIVEGLDRLAREYRIQETLLIYLASKGIDLINACTEENVTQAVMADPMKKALVQIQGVFAELEKSLLVKKLKVARDRMRDKTGKCEGRKSYREIAPEIIEEMKLLRRKPKGIGKRLSYAAIADALNDKGYRTADGKVFTGNNVAVILHRQKI